jgi:hypothetical protein
MPDFAQRMFTYCALLLQKHALRVYPIALFSFPTPRAPEPSQYRIDFPDFNVLTFNFRVVQLNQLAWRDFLDRTNPVAAALMANMAMQPTEKPQVKLACLTMLARLQLDPARKQLISGFIDQYLRLTIEQKQEFEVELDRLVPQEKEGVMEIVTSWMEEGIEKGRALGIEKGRVEGREEGERKLVLHQLQRKFGVLDPATVKEIEALPTDRIEELGDALLSFATRVDMDTWLQSHHS